MLKQVIHIIYYPLLFDDDDDAVALQPRPGLGLPFGFHDSLY
jgi:hypothetical protein